MRLFSYSLFLKVSCLGLIVMLLYVGVFGKRGLRDYRWLIKTNEEILSRIKEASQKKENLVRQIHALKTNRDEQERLIRQMLGYVKPEEIIIEF